MANVNIGPSGQLCELMYFIDDDMHGEFKEWDEHNRLAFQTFYEYGELKKIVRLRVFIIKLKTYHL